MIQGPIMVFVRFGRGEVEASDLPAACVRCGAPAFVWKARRLGLCPPGMVACYCACLTTIALPLSFMALTWLPGAVQDELELAETCILFGTLYAYILGPWFLKQWEIVRLPFCERHQFHWSRLILFDLMSGILVTSLLIGMLGIPAWLEVSPLSALRWQGWLLSLMMLAVILWVVVKTVASILAVRINEITEASITLRGIHPAFREALWRWRHTRTQKDPCSEEPASTDEVFDSEARQDLPVDEQPGDVHNDSNPLDTRIQPRGDS